MSGTDKWTTPKQIKIERAGDPRPLRRGPLKKAERRKGRKARIDELLSSRNTLLSYAEHILRERKRRIEHPEWYRPYKGMYPWYPHWEEDFDKMAIRHQRLLSSAINDKIITSVDEWIVLKP